MKQQFSGLCLQQPLELGSDVERVITEPQLAAASLSGPPAQAQVQAQWWYDCQDSQSFFPDVQQCASPWQLVAPQPQR